MTTTVRNTVELQDEQPNRRPVVAGVLAFAVGALLVIGLLDQPTESAALPAIARYATLIAQPLWHTTEPVNEIVYGTRGFDTFGETFLLLAAVLGVGMISRSREPRIGFIGEEQLGREEKKPESGSKSGREQQARQAESQEQGEGHPTPDDERLGRGLESAQAMTVIVRGAARAGSPLVAAAGVYLFAWGYSPGGGFPAGAVILGVVLLAYVAYGYRRMRKVVRPAVVEPIEMIGALLIVAVEVLGLVFKGSFSANWMPLGPEQTIQSGGILQAFSGSELIEVATGLILAIFGILGMTHDWGEDE